MRNLSSDALVRMRVPELFWQARLKYIPDSGPTEGYKKVVLNYIDNMPTVIDEGQGLLLHGEYSRGKSALAAILLKAAACSGRIGLWVKTSDIPKFIIEQVEFDRKESMSDRMISVPILVIDELILYGDNRDAYVEQIIRSRIEVGGATVCTTNLSPVQIRGKYSALAAVMKESIFPVLIEGVDFREAKKDFLMETMTKSV